MSLVTWMQKETKYSICWKYKEYQDCRIVAIQGKKKYIFPICAISRKAWVVN